MSAAPAGARAPAGEAHDPMSDAARQADTSEPGAATAAPHPEEMKATVELRLGRSVSIRATARATPAGLVAATVLVSALLIPVVWLAGARKRDRLRAG